MADLQRVIIRASRLQRLAKLGAPAVILVQAEQLLRQAVDRRARAMESDPDELRAELAAADAAARAEPLTQEDEAELREMEAEMAAYEAAEPIARERWLTAMLLSKSEVGALSDLWAHLDSSYRSDLVFAVMDERRQAPDAAHG